ncbi:hypothetical protein WL88_25730 [Burkholderia diffusa]|uniref:Uncharacterized protein n=1 Tax=Burkholderia diffusa TaxID=488732 RepID=A0AAW3PA02_9BURK|nr:hypothetical protein WL86_29750 [Burkholderia diffusa]KWF38670.1 hypothetical protein WL85_10915 [Burkholderia diffusa]KWF46715.1 hypothetical protein WL88_25730 [Burkholderia diffusa]KWF50713.1 hypothetical protein WL87_16190 [Burkholderia diffusa]
MWRSENGRIVLIIDETHVGLGEAWLHHQCSAQHIVNFTQILNVQSNFDSIEILVEPLKITSARNRNDPRLFSE